LIGKACYRNNPKTFYRPLKDIEESLHKIRMAKMYEIENLTLSAGDEGKTGFLARFYFLPQLLRWLSIPRMDLSRHRQTLTSTATNGPKWHI
jgi:hypothetical protein